jgi:uncharacterized protein
MGLLSHWLHRHDAFLQLMEASAEDGQASVQALQRILTNPSVTPTLEEFAASRRHDKQIMVEIHELLRRHPLTVLEREDVENLARALYRIPKTVEKFAERYLLTVPQLRDVDFSRQTALLEQASETVVTMLRQVRESRPRKEVVALNQRLQQIEGDADKLMLQLLREIYGADWPALKVIIVKDLFELLERGLDRCRDAGGVMAHITLRGAGLGSLARSLLSL